MRPKRARDLDEPWGMGARWQLSFNERQAILDGARIESVIIETGGVYLKVEGVLEGEKNR